MLTLHVYDANKFEETLELVDSTSPYALTGSIISQDRYAIDVATHKLRNAAGNFYINDKPTGAVVGQQPFGGARVLDYDFEASIAYWVVMTARTFEQALNEELAPHGATALVAARPETYSLLVQIHPAVVEPV